MNPEIVNGVALIAAQYATKAEGYLIKTAGDEALLSIAYSLIAITEILKDQGSRSE
jgi:hypothetical protein